MSNTPSTEERVWAVISHLSAIAFGMGLLLPVIGWSEQRRKSKYASFQCLQALGYQSLGYTVWLLSYLILMIVFILVFAVAISLIGEQNNSVLASGISIFVMILFLGGFGLYIIFPVIAAISCAMGREYRYPILGGRLARYLGYEPTALTDEPTWLIEDHEDRWVVAMGHISVIIALWGILAPITTWILQGKRSLFLKFQAVQTVAFQVLVNGMNMVAGVIYMAGFILFIALTGFDPGQPSSTGMVGLGALMMSMICAMLVILLVPLMHVLGQWAGYRVLKGGDYHYPLVGGLVERWMNRGASSPAVETSLMSTE